MISHIKEVSVIHSNFVVLGRTSSTSSQGTDLKVSDERFVSPENLYVQTRTKYWKWRYASGGGIVKSRKPSEANHKGELNSENEKLTFLILR
jgi:hypothetical protein